MRFLTGLVTLPIVLIVLVFALKNGQNVTLDFWPFDVSVSLPLSVLSLTLLFLGFLIGGVWTGLATMRWRFRCRRLERDLVELSQKEKTP